LKKMNNNANHFFLLTLRGRQGGGFIFKL